MHFPELHPDELLLSYIGRVARLNCISRGQVQSAVHQRFGDVELTGARKTWSVPLAGALGLSVPELLTGHTLEPLIRVNSPPIAPDRASPLDHGLLAAIQQTEVSVQGRSLRLCSSCVREDLGFWGYSYWRRSHQLHGVRWCLKHRCGLQDVHDRCAENLFPEECEAAVRAPLTYIHSEPVRRFADICVGLLEIEGRIPVWQSRYRMRRQTSALGLRLSLLGQRATVSDHVADHFPARWLVELIPSFRAKVARQYLPVVDSVCRNGEKQSVGVAFALVLAALYQDADEALLDISRPLAEEEAEDMALTATPKIAGARAWQMIQQAKMLSPAMAPEKVSGEHQPWPFVPHMTRPEAGLAC